ncbi:TPA: DNA-binding protein, partial [Klebsiella pneumoniae]|nr:DNA-binding protein [Klebsiella pneumoniae]HEN1568611.1 DNA-binding protein [Klebsiella pneumoniae]
LNTLIDNLNTLICEDSLLTRQERETLVLAVAAIGAMKARVGLLLDYWRRSRFESGRYDQKGRADHQ